MLRKGHELERPYTGEEDRRWCFAGARIWLDVVKAPEDLDCGIPLYAVVFAQVRLLCAVDFHQRNVLLFQRRCSLFIFGCKSLAVTTPWRKELGKY